MSTRSIKNLYDALHNHMEYLMQHTIDELSYNLNENDDWSWNLWEELSGEGPREKGNTSIVCCIKYSI